MPAPHSPLDGPQPDLGLHIAHPPIDDKISVIVVHHNRPEFLNICLQSIAVCSSNNNYELIVVDSGSTKSDALNYLNDLEQDQGVKVVRKRENVYWSAAANAGARAAAKDSKYFIFLHDDTVVLNPAWMDMLVNVADGKKSGLVGTSKHSYLVDRQRYEYLEENCLMVTRNCWEDCGPFEEELPIVGAAFILNIAATHGGYNVNQLPIPLVHHYAAFSIDISKFESSSLEASEKIVKIMPEAQRRASKNVARNRT